MFETDSEEEEEEEDKKDDEPPKKSAFQVTFHQIKLQHIYNNQMIIDKDADKA